MGDGREDGMGAGMEDGMAEDGPSPEDLSRAADALRDCQERIMDALWEAKQILAGPGMEGAMSRAKAYWLAHVEIAVSNGHGYLAGSMCSMDDTIEEIEEAMAEAVEIREERAALAIDGAVAGWSRSIAAGEAPSRADAVIVEGLPKERRVELFLGTYPALLPAGADGLSAEAYAEADIGARRLADSLHREALGQTMADVAAPIPETPARTMRR